MPKDLFGKMVKEMTVTSNKKSKTKREKLSAADEGKLWKKQKGKCNLCKNDFITNRSAHQDHIKAIALRGTNKVSNYQLICGNCHTEKNKEDAKKIAALKRKETKKKNDATNFFKL